MPRNALALLALAAASVACTNSTCVPAPGLQVDVAQFDGVDGAGEPIYVQATSATVTISTGGGAPYDCYAKDPGVYQCVITSNGDYRVAVTVAGEEQSQTATFDDVDDCGVIEPQELRFQFGGPPDAADAGT